MLAILPDKYKLTILGMESPGTVFIGETIKEKFPFENKDDILYAWQNKSEA